MGTPNAIAHIALLAYPVFAILLFTAMRPVPASIWTILLGVLFLPPNFSFDLPYVPPLDSEGIPCIAAYICCRVYAKGKLRQNPLPPIFKWIFVFMFAGIFLTALTNADPIRYGPVTLPGESLYDAFASCIKTALVWWIPFYLGYKMVTTCDDVYGFFKIMVIAGLIYSLFILVEVRMSPQWSKWIYGYHQQEFVQTLRWGGYRPKVFMRHGLNLALFLSMVLIAAAALKRVNLKPFGYRVGPIIAYIALVLIACKSTGAIVYSLVTLPAVLWLGYTGQLKFALIIATIQITYPISRTFDLIPTEEIVEFFRELIGNDRARSLWFRFATEQEVLVRARERLWFGWGEFQRPFIFDPATGVTRTIIDGYWAYKIGAHGFVGFLTVFGMLLLPVFLLPKYLKSISDQNARLVLSALAVFVVLYVLDLFPNSSIHAYLTYAVGMLAGAPRHILALQNRPAFDQESKDGLNKRTRRGGI